MNGQLILEFGSPIAVLGMMVLLSFRLVSPAQYYYMDPDHCQKDGRTFVTHLTNYMSTARLMIGLAAASIAGIAAYLGKLEPNRFEIARGLVAWPLSFFGWTVIYGVLFTGSLAWRYEVYCHNPDSYTRPW